MKFVRPAMPSIWKTKPDPLASSGPALIFTNTPAGYDTLQEGLLFHGNYAPFTLRLNSFEATYAANGEASNYVSNVSVYDHGRKVTTRDILVNDFLSVDGVNVYQQDYGWAPTVVVKNPAGQTVYDRLVMGVERIVGPDQERAGPARWVADR